MRKRKKEKEKEKKRMTTGCSGKSVIFDLCVFLRAHDDLTLFSDTSTLRIHTQTGGSWGVSLLFYFPHWSCIPVSL